MKIIVLVRFCFSIFLGGGYWDMRRYAWLICFRSLKFPREVSGGRIPCPPNQRPLPETLLECIGMWWTCWILMYIYNYELGSPSPSIMIKPFLNGVKSAIIDRYTYIIEIPFFVGWIPMFADSVPIWFAHHMKYHLFKQKPTKKIQYIIYIYIKYVYMYVYQYTCIHTYIYYKYIKYYMICAWFSLLAAGHLASRIPQFF